MKKLQILFAAMCLSTLGMAQSIQRQVINSAGGTFTNGGITLTTNIGEAVIGTISNNGITLRQGFLQPDDSVDLSAPIYNVGNLAFCQGDSVKLFTNFISGNTYQWTFNGTPISGATDTVYYANASGSYRVVVSDGSNSATSNEKLVTVNSLPVVSIQASKTQICQGQNLTLSGVGANSYAWSTGSNSSSISVSLAGNYTVVGTDTNGCVGSSSPFSLTVNSLPSVSLSNSKSSNSFCFGDSTTLTASGATTYVWNNTSNSSSIVVNQTGVYSVVGTDANGCSNSDSISITVNALPNIQVNAGGATTFCAGNNVNLQASGGVSYLWSDGSTGNSLQVSQSGNYSVIGTDANGCSNNSNGTTVTVNALPSVSVQASGATTFCQGGSVTLSANGANSYVWSNSATSSSINVNQSGNYSVVGTDANGCSSSSSGTSVTVNAPVVPTISAVGNTNVCNTNVTINSTSASNYLWSNGATTQSIVASASGQFSVTTTDANGCQATSNVIKVNRFTAVPAIPASVTGNLNPCLEKGTSNTITYTATPSATALSYAWTFSNGITAVGRTDSNVVSVTFPASFTTGTITVKAVNSCGNSSTRTISPKTQPISTVPTFTQFTTTACSIKGTSNSATFSIQPIAGCSSYLWTAPANSTIVSGQGTNSVQVTFASAFTTGNISVIGVSSCGNSPSSSVAVGLIPKPVVSGPPSICPGDQATYTAQLIQDVTRYRFNLPAGLALVSQNLNSAVITNTGSFVSGSLSVSAYNAGCGWSYPGAIALNTAACRGTIGNVTINIYPNPSRGEFQMQLGTTVKNVQVSVYAADGRLVKRQEFGQVENQTLYYNDVAEGLYHLEIITTDAENNVLRHNEKIMIQR